MIFLSRSFSLSLSLSIYLSIYLTLSLSLTHTQTHTHSIYLSHLLTRRRIDWTLTSHPLAKRLTGTGFREVVCR